VISYNITSCFVDDSPLTAHPRWDDKFDLRILLRVICRDMLVAAPLLLSTFLLRKDLERSELRGVANNKKHMRVERIGFRLLTVFRATKLNDELIHCICAHGNFIVAHHPGKK
jgi:hypothetical protein